LEEKPGPVPRFDLLTRAGSWACPLKTQAQEKPMKVKKCPGLDSGYRKNPGRGPGPARSLMPDFLFLQLYFHLSASRF